MIRVYTATLFVCALAMYSTTFGQSVTNAAGGNLFPDGSDTNQLGVFLSFDRTDNEGKVEYIQGMPVILDVRLANVPAKRRNTGAKRIRIAREWGKALRFALHSAEGLPAIAPFHPIQQEEESADSFADLFENDLRSEWILDANRTKELVPGRYTLMLSLGSIRCESSFVIAERQQKHESMIDVRKSWTSYREKKFAEAIGLAQQAMDKHGRLARDGENYAIIIMAQSKEKSGHDREALKMFEEFMDSYVPQHPRQECDLVKLKIAELKARLQQNKP